MESFDRLSLVQWFFAWGKNGCNFMARPKKDYAELSRTEQKILDLNIHKNLSEIWNIGTMIKPQNWPQRYEQRKKQNWVFLFCYFNEADRQVFTGEMMLLNSWNWWLLKQWTEKPTYWVLGTMVVPNPWILFRYYRALLQRGQ